MKKSIVSALLFLLLNSIACKEESFFEAESPHKNEITTYLTELASSADSDLSSKIQRLQDELNFRNVSAHGLRGGEKVLIVDVISLPGFSPSETIKAAFVVNNNNIVRAHLVSFSNSKASHTNEVIALLSYSVDPKSYSGKMSLYNLFGEIQFFSVAQNGQLIESGNVNAKQDDNARVNGCINWYLTTTYYYFDGGTRTTHEYLFTTCDDGCNTVRIAGKINCGGGGMGGGGDLGGSQPMFPTNPRSGDEYEFTDTDGKTTSYKFVSNTWTITQVILSVLLVQSQPSIYPYLITNAPYNGLTLFGPDNFIYVYNAWSGSWVGTLPGHNPYDQLTNNVTDPCMRQQVENAIDADLSNELSNLMQSVFNINEDINIEFNQSSDLATDTDAETNPTRITDGVLSFLNIEITLNANTLPNVSQEYIMSTIYHEILHAILHYNGITGNEQHQSMANDYVARLATALREHFPNLSLANAQDLSWGGLQETTAWESLSSTAQNRIINLNQDHRTGQLGTSCN